MKANNGKKRKKNIKILFVGNRNSSFIKNDYRLLQKNFDVKPISMSCLSLTTYLLKAFFLVKWADVVFCWFASIESFFPLLFAKLFKKKSIVVAGGYDCANEPEMDYGSFTNFREKIAAEYVFKNANVVLAVSKFVKKQTLEKITPKQLKIIYNGVNIKKFESKKTKDKIIVTIGQATQYKYKIKGLETFARASAHFPDYKFVIIGQKDECIYNKLKGINENLVFTGKIPHDRVLKWLQKARVYCQLSYIESFGLGLAEAMSCNCIPVVTDRGSLSEIVGDAGFYVSYEDEKGTVEAIKRALETSDQLGEKARKRILKLFNFEKRERDLTNFVEAFLS